MRRIYRKPNYAFRLRVFHVKHQSHLPSALEQRHRLPTRSTGDFRRLQMDASISTDDSLTSVSRETKSAKKVIY